MKIKVNDKVKILSGKDATKNTKKEGKVIQVFPQNEKVVVEGVNIMKRHLRTRKDGEKGQILELAAPINISKVMLMCPKCSKPTRVGYKMDGDKKKRVCKKCNQFVD
jgi:large subunit ribosomal protein L24